MKPTFFHQSHADASTDEKIVDVVARGVRALGRIEDRDKEITQRRFELAGYYNVPYLLQTLGDTSKMTALEVGCGRGGKTGCFAPFFGDYVGIDLSEGELRYADKFIREVGADNVQLMKVEAADIRLVLNGQKFDVIILFAILEHLTITEKIDLLKTCYDSLPEGGAVYFAEAPNRAAPVDLHSSRLPHFSQLPLELARLYGDKSMEGVWLDRVRNASGEEGMSDLALMRNGVHVGYHEFELAFGSLERLNEIIAADNYSPYLMNLYPELWFEAGMQQDIEFLGRSRFIGRTFDIPFLFGRYWIEGVLRKGASHAPLTSRMKVRCEESQKADSQPSEYLAAHGQHIEIATNGAGNAGVVNIGYRPRSTAGTFVVEDADGIMLHAVDTDYLREVKPPHRDYQTFIGLPADRAGPFRIRPEGRGSRVSLISAYWTEYPG